MKNTTIQLILSVIVLAIIIVSAYKLIPSDKTGIPVIKENYSVTFK
jgi:hypothetical protein